MECEIQSLNSNNVWDAVPLPDRKKVVGSKWVYKVKKGSDGAAKRYKARLIAQGYTQQHGADYDETFNPVVRLESLRVLMAQSEQCDLKLHPVYVKTAFIKENLDKEVYMEQPRGFTMDSRSNFVCGL